ncbi:porin [Cupriavidus pauculus]|uniref:porin n=1 Tax=Cupriavidus pauculus TaxID=82633 RepID=UPI0007819EE2|nr:porin [Cupriavidus pauculus]
MKSKALVWFAGVASVCAGSAYGQSNVTLYGVVDTGIEYQNHQPSGNNSIVRMTPGNMSGSRWGLRGTEDLGGGLKSLFVLESGFDSDTGRSGQNNRLFGRSAYVGLQGNWGALTLGRQTNTLYDIFGTVDPMWIASKYSILVQDAHFSARADNTVKYVGTFGGVTAKAMYSFGADSTRANASEIPGSPKIGREMGGSLTYTGSNWEVVAAYDDINTGTTTATPDATTRRAVVGGNFVVGNATIFAGYRWAKGYDGAALPGAPAASSQRSNQYWTGVRYQITAPLTLVAAAYYQDFADTSADPWFFVLSSDYALSKRTDAYLNVGYTKNKNGSTLGLGSFGTVNGSANQFGAVVGIRHKF